MDGPQNAQQGYAGFNEIPGKDQPENEPWPVAEAHWESSMQAMVAVSLAGYTGKPDPEGINLDIYRWQRELVHPRNYANMNYWELWLFALSYYMMRSGRGGIVREDLTDGDPGIVSSQELDHADEIRELGMSQAVPGFSKPDDNGLFTSSKYKQDAANDPRYKAGQKVRSVLQASAGHTREYQYLRGRDGVIEVVYPVTVPGEGQTTGSGEYEVEYADINSRGLQRYFIPIYSVRYSGNDLWGDDFAEPNTYVYADMWETYIEPRK